MEFRIRTLLMREFGSWTFSIALIRVILDIPGTLAPNRLHGRYPGVDGRTLCVNTTDKLKKVTLDKEVHGVFSGRIYKSELELAPYGDELVK